MIVTLLAWIYITIISLAWGNIVLQMITPKEQVMTEQEPEWPLVCLTGLCIIGALSLTIALFMPLGLGAHLIISFPALLYYAFPGNRHRVAGQFRLAFQKPVLSFFLLLVSCMIVILVINADQVIHPDTLAYHAQAIHQMEYFGTIPGIVHVDNEVAMSSTWFALQAIFRFNFIHDHPFLFVNGCVVCWFCIFVCLKLTRAIMERQNRKLAGWLLLLLFSFASWTQIRLTAASASPDFIAALLIWAACYNLVATPSKRNTFLTVLFSAAAVSMKLSAIPVLLLPAICIVQQFMHRKFTFAMLLTACCTLVIVPWLVRNVFTSGYPLFPSDLLNIFNVDWKLNIEKLHEWQRYISIYARMPVEDSVAAERASQLSFTQWLPRWWQHLYIADQLLLGLTVVLLLFTLFTIPKQIRLYNSRHLILLTVVLTGSLVWWLNAPDPRFGTGFLIPLIYVLSTGAGGIIHFFKRPVPPVFCRPALNTFAVALLLYTTYRLISFFDGTPFLFPTGVKEVAYVPVSCQGITLSLAKNPNETGFAPPPCVQDSCRQWVLRGNDLRAGFKARQ